MRVVFLGTPEFAVPSLTALVEVGHQVLAVVTQPDKPRGRGQHVQPSPVKTKAQELGLPVLQPERVSAPEFIEQMRALDPEAVVVVAFGQKIPPALLTLPPLGCINLHASLLPAYRGAAPIVHALWRGEEVTGVTTMYMDEGWDTGDIILQRPVPIRPEDTAGSLHDRLAAEGAQLLCQTLAQIAAGTAPRAPQDENRASYAPRLREEDAALKWERPALELHNQVRAFNPVPGAYFYWSGRRIKVWRTAVLKKKGEAEAAGPPGEVVTVDHQSGALWVRCGEGQLALLEVQPENRGRMTGAELARGYRIQRGALLGG